MDILYYLSSLCLIIFMVLATYDGFYLHIWKFELFKREESKFEHKTHTIRAILFPIILWLLFIDNGPIGFWLGITFFIFDLIVLGLDAHSENDSRKSIGGMPKWEYILHLFANSFHFGSIILIIATKINVSEFGLSLNESVNNSFAHNLTEIIAVNIIPGAVILALVHLILILPKGIHIWNKNRMRLKCC